MLLLKGKKSTVAINIADLGTLLHPIYAPLNIWKNSLNDSLTRWR